MATIKASEKAKPARTEPMPTTLGPAVAALKLQFLHKR
jgi:hypothetical protein